MTVTMSEALAGCLAEQPDVPEDMFELLAAMVADDDCPATSEWMLQHEKLPLSTAEKLIARRGVSAAELAAFAARDDMPAETLLAWVRKESRVTVLAQIAAKPNLPREVFETLATRNGVALQTALLFNESAPASVRAVIAADQLVADRTSYAERRVLRRLIAGSELLQLAVFDRLGPDALLVYASAVAEWDGLTAAQLHSLLDASVRHTATIPTLAVGATRQARNDVNNALIRSRLATRCLAEHPSADTGLLDRLEKFLGNNPACRPKGLDESVATARLRLAVLGDDCEPLRSVPYSKLVELADSGALCTALDAQWAAQNPLFDTDVAVLILEAGNRLDLRDPDVEWMLRDWAPDLASGLRIQRAMKELSVCMPGLPGHVSAASTGELVAALDSVADDPAWALRLAEAIAADGVDDDDVVGRFGWFPEHVAAAPKTGRCRVGELTVEYLYRRFGAHYPTWRMFGSIADPSTSLAEAADLAVHAEPSPNPGTAHV